MATYIYSDPADAQFENVNSLRSYPFVSDPVAKDGRALPEDIISDLKLFVPGVQRDIDYKTHDPGPVAVSRLTSLHVSPSMLSVCFISTCGTYFSALSVMVSMAEFRPYSPYRLEKLHGAENAGGVVTFGNFIPPPRPETYIFDGAEVLPCCVSVARPADLRSFYDPRSGKSLSGDVRMDFSSHIKVQSNRGQGFGGYALSLEDGAEELLAAKCDDNGMPCGATPIVSINGIAPDEEGNIVLWFH